MPKDPIKVASRRARYRAKAHSAKYGPDAGDQRGRHGNHARGEKNAKWKGGRFITSQGYVAVRVDPSNPHAWGAHPTVKYAYEHILVAERAAGRALASNEIVHHAKENKQDNRDTELEIMTAADHAREHCRRRGRDHLGRFHAKST